MQQVLLELQPCCTPVIRLLLNAPTANLDLTDLFEEASALLKSSTDVKQTAGNLRKALALSSNYNRVKAWQAVAAHEAAQSELGLACADLQVWQPHSDIAVMMSCTAFCRPLPALHDGCHGLCC